MRQIVEAGTDGATLCFFDPAALPVDFDKRVKDGPIELFEELENQGRFWWSSVDGDGGYLFHFYVEEETPKKIAQHRVDQRQLARLLVPSGQIWACGAEYAANNPAAGNSESPRGGLTKYSHMGGRCEIPPGEYEVAAWRTEWPKGFVENDIKERIGSGAWRRQEALGQTTGYLFFLLALGTIVSIGFAVSKSTLSLFGPGTAWCWGVIGILWVVCIILIRALKKIEANSPRKGVEREFPSIIVEMKRLRLSSKEI